MSNAIFDHLREYHAHACGIIDVIMKSRDRIQTRGCLFYPQLH